MDMKHNKLWTLFWTTFQISACTFGGGFVIIALMRKKFVDQLHWIEEQEMLDLTAIAQSSPGAIAVNASILVGYHVGGVGGAILAALGSVLPPFIIISIISFFYDAFRTNPIVNLAMTGMLAGVAAVIFDVVIGMLQGILKTKKLVPILTFITVFIAVRFFNVSIILVILVCGVLGAAQTVRKDGAK